MKQTFISLTLFLSVVFAGCGGSMRWSSYSCLRANSTLVGFWNADRISGTTVYDKNSYPKGNNGTMSSGITLGTSLVGNSYVFSDTTDQIGISSSTQLSTLSAMTLSAWVKSRIGSQSSSTLQTILSNSGLQTQMDVSPLWKGVDMTGSEALSDSGYRGFKGGVFDGRYIYFTPGETGAGAYSGKVARYDTQGSLKSSSSWKGVDLTSLSTLGSNYKGFNGAVFDGRYVYFVPYDNGAVNTSVARYDTQVDFTLATSWDGSNLIDMIGPTARRFQGGIFDGRYVYFISNATSPTLIARYDAQSSFTNSASWKAFDLSTLNATLQRYAGGTFDGRYLYFVQWGGGTGLGTTVRYDSTQDFSSSSSWEFYDIKTNINSNLKGFSGAVFDGRYVYHVPLYNGAHYGLFARYDTQVGFTTASSWETFDVSAGTALGPLYAGFIGGTFDGRYLYFPSSTTRIARYDSQGSFTSVNGWSGVDLSSSSGLGSTNYRAFISGIFDGRYIYLIPNGYGGTTHGNLAQFDTAGTLGGYSFKLTDNIESGFGNALFGPTFTIASGSSVLNVSSQQGSTGFAPDTWHHIAATYDGATMKIYLDGELNAQAVASGAINISTANLVLGSTPAGAGTFPGELSQVQIYSSALSDSDIRNIYNTTNVAFCE